MNILHVTKKYPHALGGDAVVVANLQKQQQAAGHRVAIVTSNCDEIKGGQHIYKCGLKDTPAQLDVITAKRMVSLLLLCFRMFAIVHKERPDIIHTHSIDMAFFVSFAARWHRIPLVHTFHIVTFYDENQSFLRRKSEMWLAKKAKLHSATAPNEYDVKKLQTAGLKQATLLPNGVDLALWKSRGYIEKNRETTFVAVGRLEDQKGYDYLIKAAALLAGTQPLKLIIVGEGSQKAALLALIEQLNATDTITLVGRKSPSEIRTLLAQSHVAVFSSLYETTPLTLLEAWAASVPTISTAVGILRETPPIFHASLVVPPRDKWALADAMQQYVESSQLRSVSALAGLKEAQKYGWPQVAEVAETIYRSAL